MGLSDEKKILKKKEDNLLNEFILDIITRPILRKDGSFYRREIPKEMFSNDGNDFSKDGVMKQGELKLKEIHNVMIEQMKLYKHIEEEYNTLKNVLEFKKNLSNVKCYLLKNYGREGRYIYGQVYYNINPTSKKKKPFRFLIGKMSENNSDSEWLVICRNIFLERMSDEWGTTDSEISKWLKKHDMDTKVLYIRESTRELIKTLKDEI